MDLFYFIVALLSSIIFPEECVHHRCEANWGYNGIGWMVLIPFLIVGALLVCGFYQASQESGPKRVFISDVDGSKESGITTKGTPVAHTSGAKPHQATHHGNAKPHTVAHHVSARAHEAAHHQAPVHAK